MYSPKTLTQALLIASIATSSLAAHIPDRDGIHGARAGLVLPAGLTKEAVKQNKIKNNTARGFDTQDLDARAIPLPNISPEIVDLIKTSAVGGLVGGATSATVNGLINLFKDKDGTQQSRDLGALSDGDLRLLSVLSRRVIEELD